MSIILNKRKKKKRPYQSNESDFTKFIKWNSLRDVDGPSSSIFETIGLGEPVAGPSSSILHQNVTVRNKTKEIDLFNVYEENTRFSEVELYNIDNQFRWYICFRSQIFLDSLHDFIIDKRCVMSEDQKQLFTSIIWSELNDELYKLWINLYMLNVTHIPNLDPINDEHYIKKIKDLFPNWEDQNSEMMGNTDWCIFNCIIKDIPVPDLAEFSLKLLWRCGIDKTTLLTQKILNPVSSNFNIDMKNELLKTIINNHKESHSFDGKYILTCDITAEVVKFQYTIPMLKLNLIPSNIEYHTTIANSYDAGSAETVFSKMDGLAQKTITGSFGFNVYFEFKKIDGFKYKNDFINFHYNSLGDAFINSFSGIENKDYDLKKVEKGECSVNLLCNSIKNVMKKYEIKDKVDQDLTDKKVLFLAAYKLIGDLGKTLYSYCQYKKNNKLVFHVSTDIISSNIAGIFLPGTIHSSLSEAKSSKFLDFEFFYLRDSTNWEKTRQLVLNPAPIITAPIITAKKRKRRKTFGFGKKQKLKEISLKKLITDLNHLKWLT